MFSQYSSRVGNRNWTVSSRREKNGVILLPNQASAISSLQRYNRPGLEEVGPIDGALTYHDRHQFEARLAYSLSGSAENVRYRVQAYFYVPWGLDINSRTFSRQDFYQDLKDFIRFNVPRMSLDKLADKDNDLSPYAGLIRHLDDFESGKSSPVRIRGAVQGFKLFGCIFAGSLHEGIEKLDLQIDRLASVPESGRLFLIGQIVETGDSFLHRLHGCVSNLRAMRTKVVAAGVPDEILSAFEQVDEYLSLLIEKEFTPTYAILKPFVNDPDLVGLGEKIADQVISEQNYRRGSGYVTVLDAESGKTKRARENYSHRVSLLKKFVSSILHLKTTEKESSMRARQVGYAIAAGIAMFIAAVISSFAGRTFGIDSLAFFTLIVVGYMIKDRIKDLGREYLGGKFSAWVADYNTSIRDPFTQKVIGNFRQHFRFLDAQDVPRDIARMRAVGSSHRSGDDFWEHVFLYDKTVSLKVRREGQGNPLFSHVYDILRFNFSKFLAKMDEPTSSQERIDPVTRELTRLNFPKIYHINVVLRLHCLGGKEGSSSTLKKVRIILNKKGIRRIEEIE